MAARSKAAFDPCRSPILASSPAVASLAASTSRSYLSSTPFLPRLFPVSYRHSLLPFGAAGSGGFISTFHSLLAGLACPKLGDYQNLINVTAAATLQESEPVTNPLTTSSTSNRNLLSAITNDSENGKSNSNPNSPTYNSNADPDDNERKAESIHALRMKAHQHEARSEEKPLRQSE